MNAHAGAATTAPDTLPQAPSRRAAASTLRARLLGAWAPRRFRISLAAALFVGLCIAFAWTAVLLNLRSRRDDAIAATAEQNANLAAVVGEQTLRVLASIDEATRRVAAVSSDHPGHPVDLVKIAQETGLAPEILIQLSLVDADGRFVASNLDPDGRKGHHVDLSKREHVLVHLHPQALPRQAARVNANGLFIGPPVLGKVSGKWTIQVSRRIDGPEGQVDGVVVASLDPAYFESVYARVNLGAHGTVALVGADGVVRARVIGGQPSGMGTTVPAGSRLHVQPTAGSGHFVAADDGSGARRIVAFRQVASYPLFVVVTSEMGEVLAHVDATRRLILVLMGVLTVTVGLAAVSFVASIRRLERGNEVLRLSAARAREASEAKSAFIAAVSHELRTPLTSILGFAELLESRLQDARQARTAGIIRGAAKHLGALLEDMLDLTRLEAHSIRPHCDAVDVRALVDDVAGLFSLAASAKGLVLDIDIAADVPATVQTDGLRLRQIVTNLLSNAVKFTAAGSVRLSLALEGSNLACHVVDTGPGIASDMQEVIFERFRQGHARVSCEHGGTGLGLALSRGLAELLGGSLTLHSELGRGARFTLLLPIAPPASAPRQAAPALVAA